MQILRLPGKINFHFYFAVLLLSFNNCSFAQQYPESFTKTNIYGGKWSKNVFANAVIVEGKYKTMYIAGMGSENPDTGKIEYEGDFKAQCRMAYKKVRKIIQANGGKMSDIVRVTAYLTDMRDSKDYVECEKEALGKNTPLPPHTLLNVTQLAWPGMVVEVEVTAIIPH